eukprot:288341_1
MNNNCVTKLRSKLRIHRYFNSHTSNDITEGSFNCIGDDNYAIIYRFTNEQLCSNLIITITGNKEDESNDNINEVQILYRATQLEQRNISDPLNAIREFNAEHDDRVPLVL